MQRSDYQRARDPYDSSDYTPPEDTPAPPKPTKPGAGYGPPVARVYGTDRVPGRVVYLRRRGAINAKVFNDYSEGDEPSKSYAGDAVIAFAEADSRFTAVVPQFWRGRQRYASGSYLPLEDPSRLVSRGHESYLGPDGSLSWVLQGAAIPWDGFDGEAAGMTMKGLCQLRAKLLTLPDHGVGDFTFEVCGVFSGGTVADADPAEVLLDLIAQAAPGTTVDVDVGPDGTAASSFRTYCAANGFRVSKGIAEHGATIEEAEELLAACDSILVWSEGRYKAVPLGDTPIGAYVPPSTAVALDSEEWLRDDDQPTLIIERVPEADVRNCFPVRIRAREW
ncbi:MAG TPA: hypothetical protein VD838_15435, partial [Anaeromyxobacteraceae bacterium]|nr:hypothetical protein [Anaeromyxobacteraceae bacterium]